MALQRGTSRPETLLAYDLVESTRGWEVKCADEDLGKPPFRVERQVPVDVILHDGQYRTQVLVDGIADYRVAKSIVQALAAAGTVVALATEQAAVE